MLCDMIRIPGQEYTYRIVWNLKKNLARDFYVVTLPTIVKIQDSPSPSPVSGHLWIWIRYRESGSGEWLRWWDVDTWDTGDWALSCAGQCAAIQRPWGYRVKSQDMQSAWCQPECCHQAVVTWWLSPSLWSLWSLWSMTPTCHYHAESGIQPPDIRHITSANIQSQFIEKYSEFYKTWYSLTTSRWDRSICKKSLILMHFLCFTQPRGAWFRPILYL